MKVLHLFCGIGGGALGFQRAGFDCVGAFDFDAAACRDFERLVGSPATVADLAALEPADLRRACADRPDVVFTSPPCKGFSGCLPAARSPAAAEAIGNAVRAALAAGRAGGFRLDSRDIWVRRPEART